MRQLRSLIGPCFFAVVVLLSCLGFRAKEAMELKDFSVLFFELSKKPTKIRHFWDQIVRIMYLAMMDFSSFELIQKEILDQFWLIMHGFPRAILLDNQNENH